jgi:membrane protease YdiL (CAAX protease family)
MRMGEILEAVKRSRFLADLSPYDRDPWRSVFAVPVGILAGAVAGLLGAISMTLAALLIVSGLDGAPAAAELFRVFSEPNMAEPTSRQSLFILAVLAGVNLGAAIGFVAAAGAIHHRRITDYINRGQPVRWRLVLGGLVLAGVVMTGVVGAAAVTGQPIEPPLWKVSPNLVGRSLYALMAISLLVLAAAAEELVFRGWLLKQSAAYVRDPVVLMILNGLLFAAIHLDPEYRRLPGPRGHGRGPDLDGAALGRDRAGHRRSRGQQRRHPAADPADDHPPRRAARVQGRPDRQRPDRPGRLHRRRGTRHALAGLAAVDRSAGAGGGLGFFPPPWGGGS